MPENICHRGIYYFVLLRVEKFIIAFWHGIAGVKRIRPKTITCTVKIDFLIGLTLDMKVDVVSTQYYETALPQTHFNTIDVYNCVNFVN